MKSKIFYHLRDRLIFMKRNISVLMQEKQNFRKLKDEVQKDVYEYRSDDQRT